MKNKKQSRGNRTMREKLEAMGMKMTPDDHPIYTTNHLFYSLCFQSLCKYKKGGG